MQTCRHFAKYNYNINTDRFLYVQTFLYIDHSFQAHVCLQPVYMSCNPSAQISSAGWDTQQHKGKLCTVKRSGGCLVQMSHHNGVPLMKSPPCQTMHPSTVLYELTGPDTHLWLSEIQQSWWSTSECRRGAAVMTCHILSSCAAMTVMITAVDVEAPVKRKACKRVVSMCCAGQHPWFVTMEWKQNKEDI